MNPQKRAWPIHKSQWTRASPKCFRPGSNSPAWLVEAQSSLGGLVVKGMERLRAAPALVAAKANADDPKECGLAATSAALRRKTRSASSTVKWRTASKIQ